MSHKKKASEPRKFKRPDWAIDQGIGDDYALEDVCKHGVGHPNREYLESLPEDERETAGIHTCDKCCSSKHTIECEEEEDGSLILSIPDDLVQAIVQSFIENALYELVKENQKLSKEIKNEKT